MGRAAESSEKSARTTVYEDNARFGRDRGARFVSQRPGVDDHVVGVADMRVFERWFAADGFRFTCVRVSEEPSQGFDVAELRFANLGRERWRRFARRTSAVEDVFEFGKDFVIEFLRFSWADAVFAERRMTGCGRHTVELAAVNFELSVEFAVDQVAEGETFGFSFD